MRNRDYPRRVRIAELMRQSLCDLLGKDGEIPFLTIHHVEVAGDYSMATVRYSLLDESPDNLERTAEYFLSNSDQIRGRMASGLQMRSTPKLEFVYAHEMRHAERISHLLKDVGKQQPE